MGQLGFGGQGFSQQGGGQGFGQASQQGSQGSQQQLVKTNAATSTALAEDKNDFMYSLDCFSQTVSRMGLNGFRLLAFQEK